MYKVYEGHWSDTLESMLLTSAELHRLADEQNDIHDHDELHAAAAVLGCYINLNLNPVDYIRTWIDGLIVLHADVPGGILEKYLGR